MTRAPLADRLRPESIEQVCGQDTVLAPGSLLRAAFDGGTVTSLVLWGPPGTGKTTLARLLAGRSGMAFEALSAVTSGVKDVRAVIARAKDRREEGQGTLLFVDEIHRFNRAQQDAFLPHIEDGTIVLVGATTENPGFSLIGALLSRLRVVTLQPIDDEGLGRILDRALAERVSGLAGAYTLDDAARDTLIAVAAGDARKLLNVLESAAALTGEGGAIGADVVREAAQTRLTAYDRSGDDRYDLLSAFHKSLRGSDVDAALFWMGRMLEGGEDPLVIARRLVAMAAEDVGLADPGALRIALDAQQAIQFLGQPEGELPLTEAVVYLATAPKSNSVVRALGAARKTAAAHMELPVPIHIRNAPTRLARELGHGKAYRYPHDHPHAFVEQAYVPEELADVQLYEPGDVGEERETKKRWAWWRRLRERGTS
ncbi:MAG: replication-associated recombination protein A [Planctomycetota bacterium]|nr:replication-associated recombination protein A [Planctomycetota bacterium]